MNKIEKELRKFNANERNLIFEILKKLTSNEIIGFDIKKLKGYNDIFRVRKGRIRIIYRKDHDGKIFILAIERRREDTYRFEI